MRFALKVGETETNLVEFAFNQLLGSTVIKVNHREVTNHRRWFSEPLQECYRVPVGTNEKWEVRIEKERKPLIGGKFAVYVNNRLLDVRHGI